MSNRRDLILQTVAAGAVLALSGARGVLAANGAPRAVKRLRVLVLGGTGYIGPHFVRAALEREHHVSVFVHSRGKGHAQLPAGVEPLMGDRKGDLESIKNRDWDAVLDLATFVPNWVRTLGAALQGRIGNYTLISTISVYENPSANQELGENGPLSKYQGSADPYALLDQKGGPEYGSLKALCEREAERQFPGRATILRPGYIVGPGDRQGYFTYLPARMQKGGKVLIAGDPTTPIQFIDVRDLADWAVRLAEKRTTGIYNAVGPGTLTRLGQLIAAARDTTAASASVTWVSPSWLSTRDDKQMWSKVLFWSFEEGGFAQIMQMSIERALKNGITFRPLSATLAHVLDWYRALPQERQAELLSIRKKKDNGEGFDIQPISWQDYLAREREVLAAWHAQQEKQK